MNYIDIGIIFFIVLGAIIGFKNGFVKQSLKAIGFVIAIVLAFLFKDVASDLLYRFLPFFPFGGVLKGVTAINILLYEVIGFFVTFALLSLILKILIMLSGIVETVLNLTVILGFFSKILGAAMGALQYYLIAFMAVYIMMLPMFSSDGVKNSKYADIMIKETPLIGEYLKTTESVSDELNLLKEKYATTEDPNEFNLEALDLMLKYKIISVKTADKLVSSGKLEIDNIESILGKYRSE